MFAAVDVGNTTTAVAFVFSENKRDIHRFPCSPDSYGPIRECVVQYSPEKALVCTVNPPFSDRIESIFSDIPVLYVDHSHIPLKNRYSPPSDVGSDRLVTAYAVVSLFNTDTVIVDMGTAVTFEVVTQQREYMGGLIFPGIGLLRKSLNDHTALLPLVEVESREYPFVALNTEDAVAGGIFRGVDILIRNMVEDIQASYGKPLTVCVTGGDAELFKDRFPREWNVVPDIIINGLTLLEKELSWGTAKLGGRSK